MSPLAVKLTHVSKAYQLHTAKPTLAENFVPRHPKTNFWALRQINLTIHQGECVGILGPNGSGKTTLLKIISGITRPTTGTVAVSGRVISLLDLTAGFSLELSGYDNLIQQLALYGHLPAKPTKLIDQIIRFAGIRPFIYAPLFTYSSGMIMRLAFAIATVIPADIFIIDEVFSVGDADFRLKCLAYLQSLRRQSKTIIASSHDLAWLLSFCTTNLILKNGRLVQPTGIPPHYLDFYRRSLKLQTTQVTITSDSMKPTLTQGQTVSLIHRPFSKLACGHIIAFIFPNYPQIIVHRVVAMGQKNGQSICITQGDANGRIDPWVITPKEYLGLISPNPA